MKKYLVGIIVILLLILTVLAGCTGNQSATQTLNFEGIELESDIVELVNASLKIIKDQNVVTRAEAWYIFHNIAGRDITVTVTVEFYDKDDNLITEGGPKFISLPNDYTERGYAPANIISYSGPGVSEVDHVKIIAKE